MKKEVAVSCPLDCFDRCGFRVRVADGQVTSVAGDPDHPVTRGVICPKGRALGARFSHPDRLRSPLIRKNGQFEPVAYDRAYDLIRRQLTQVLEQYGPLSILEYSGSGYNGLRGRIQTHFFNALGGATRPSGSLCWGAGSAAQKYDFGHVRGHSPGDVLNARLILVWGRNPGYTSLHFYRLLKTAQKQGSRVVVIDPVQTATAKGFGQSAHIRIQPSTDGALALAMAKVILDEALYDRAFVENHVLGFARFRESLDGISIKKAERITGIPGERIQSLAREYARAETATIYIGFGMQRYGNGGNAVRAIDALGALCGKVGRAGCGVNYAARSMSLLLTGMEEQSRKRIRAERFFTVGRMADFLDKAEAGSVQGPPVKAAFVTQANPLNQGPSIEKTVRAFSRIPFKVVFDHFMTDTARAADLVLPAASVFEQADLMPCSMYSDVLNWSCKAVDPPAGVVPEFDFFLDLAGRMGLDLGFASSEDYLEICSAPLLSRLGIRLSQLKQRQYVRIPGEDVAWQDKAFETPSGKIEIFSESAAEDGHSALPVFIEPRHPEPGFPLRLLTCHTNASMHSQGFALLDEMPEAFVSPGTAEPLGLTAGEDVRVKTGVGSLEARLVVDEAVPEGCLFMYQGFWHRNGAVNFLTRDLVSDMGGQAAFYDTFCTLETV